MEDLDVCMGKTSRFAAVVDGKPDPVILWYKDNILLSDSSHFTFVYDDRECSLVILSLRMKGSTLTLLRTWLGQCPVRLSLLFILPKM